MAVKVVDTSALAALLFGEPEAGAVAAKLGSHTLVVPTLLRYELGSVARMKRLRYPSLASELDRCLSTFDELDVQEVEVPIDGLTSLAASAEVTVYDAAYLWLARHLRAELVTLDKTLAGARA